MKTRARNRKNGRQENLPALCSEKTSAKAIKNKVQGKSLSAQHDGSVRNRSVLKEKTNLNCIDSLPFNLRLKDKEAKSSKAISWRENLVEEKVLRSSILTPKRHNLDITKHSEPEPDNSSSTLKRCVYMNVITEETSDKESVYEFLVDKNEPYSKRRKPYRKRQVGNRPKGLPRQRIHSKSEELSIATSSIAASSIATSSIATSCSGASSFVSSVGENVSFREAEIKTNDKHADEPTFSVSTCEKDLSSPPVHLIGTPPTPPTIVPSCRHKGTLVPIQNNSVPNFVIGSTTEEFRLTRSEETNPISQVVCVQNAAGMEPPGTPIRSSLCNSSLWSEGPTVSIASVKHHSTPCKARSGSDSSSSFQPEEHFQNPSMENCFGFSSDEEEEAVHDLPSPLHLSPRSCALRQGLISPHGAPSRFAPNVVQRTLALKAVAKPLDFCSSKGSQTDKKAKVTEGKRGGKGQTKVVGRRVGRRGRVGNESKVQSNATGNFTRSAAQPEASSFNSTHILTGTSPPTTRCLFEDLEKKDDEPLTVKPPRRSYERPLQRKIRKVVGGGLCLDSGDEGEDMVMVEGEKVVEEEKTVERRECPPKLHRRRNMNKVEKKEKELDQWASQMKMKLEEVDDFELCVE